MGTAELQQKIRSCVETMPQGNAVRRIRLFGSFLHGNIHKNSDIDLLVDFDESSVVGYFAVVRMQDAFEKALGRKVDLVTPKALSEYFRDEVLTEAKLLYEKG